MFKTILLLGCAVGASTMSALPISASAQSETPETLSFHEGDKQVFLPGFFSRFAPQTAADMVRNLPGFQIRVADNRRGLGQGGANILIDGSRVTGKSTDPMDVLGRTSHEAVTRIEILDGASLGISGLSGPVANVLLDRGKRSGNIEWNPQFRKGLATRLTNGSVSMTGMVGETSYSVSLENDSFRSGAWGEELVTGPSGELLERRYEQVQPSGENPELSLSLSRKDEAGREANLNASAGLFIFEFSELSDRTPMDPNEPERFRTINEAEDEWNAEISGDYAFDAFGGRMKLIGFQYYEDSPFQSRSRLEDEDGFVRSDRFERTVVEGETIARVEQSWAVGEGKAFELGGEIVFNFNEAESALFEIDENGMETAIDLDGANTRIEEERAEISATYNFPLGEKLDLQASAAIEYSKLSQSGELANERSFTRPKGFVTASYELSPTLELRGRIDKRVGQLNFFAFASTVSLVDGNSQVGNVDLVPQQSWFYEAALEKTFADESQMTLTLQYEDIEDIVQTIPIGNSEGTGNSPGAQRWKLEFVGTQMLDKFGIPGGQFEWDLTLRDSEILDPFTAEIRQLNGETKSYYSLEFRQDIPNTNYAYEIELEDFDNARSFRSRQVSLYDQSKPTLILSAEHKDFYGMNAEIYVFNALNFTEDFTRDIFDGRRPMGTFARREAREFAFGPIVGMNISKTF